MQTCIDLFSDNYQLITSYPAQKKFELTNLISRSVAPILANTAEGTSRSSEKEFSGF